MRKIVLHSILSLLLIIERVLNGLTVGQHDTQHIDTTTKTTRHFNFHSNEHLLKDNINFPTMQVPTHSTRSTFLPGRVIIKQTTKPFFTPHHNQYSTNNPSDSNRLNLIFGLLRKEQGICSKF